MLQIIRDTFEDLNRQEILYVHWKSNEHLHESLNGDTDFDLLIARGSLEAFVRVVEKHGFRLFESVGKQAYIGVFDYLALDPPSQKMIHLHLHCVFITGRKFLKEYAVPISSELLSGTEWDQTGLVRVCSPSKELCILWLRYFLKTSALKLILKRGRISENFRREAEWLLPRANRGDVERFASVLFKNKDMEGKSAAFADYVLSADGASSALRMLLSVRKAMKEYKTEKAVSIRYYCRRFMMGLRYFEQKYFHWPVPYRRVLPSGGRVVAVVGCDGAGKSTVNSKLLKTLQKKIDVYFSYFGSGDGYCYWYRLPLLWVNKALAKRRHGGGSSELTEAASARKRVKFSKAVWAVLLALEKKSKLKRMNCAKARGMLVLCDRYPQTQFPGINDGPILAPWLESRAFIKKKLAQWERTIYLQASIFQPDLVIKLMISEAVSCQRKPLEKPETIKAKIQLMDELLIPSEETCVVDATKPIEEVLEDVCARISRCFTQT